MSRTQTPQARQCLLGAQRPREAARVAEARVDAARRREPTATAAATAADDDAAAAANAAAGPWHGEVCGGRTRPGSAQPG